MALLSELQESLYTIKTLPFINLRRDFKENCELLHGHLDKCRDFGADVFILELAAGHETNEDLVEFLHEVKAHANELQEIFRKLKSDGMSEAFLTGTTMNTSGERD